jgi:hypothetical protein
LSGRILIPWADYEKLSLFLKGIKGDPLALSNAGARMLYYSSIVITTVGFGDIVPITYFSRTLTAFEAVLGVGLAGLFLNSLAYRASRRGDRGM